MIIDNETNPFSKNCISGQRQERLNCHIHNLHNTIMQSVLGGSLHKNNTIYLLLGLYHASVNRISIVLMQITPQDERYYGICASSELNIH